MQIPIPSFEPFPELRTQIPIPSFEPIPDSFEPVPDPINAFTASIQESKWVPEIHFNNVDIVSILRNTAMKPNLPRIDYPVNSCYRFTGYDGKDAKDRLMEALQRAALDGGTNLIKYTSHDRGDRQVI